MRCTNGSKLRGLQRMNPCSQSWKESALFRNSIHSARRRRRYIFPYCNRVQEHECYRDAQGKTSDTKRHLGFQALASVELHTYLLLL